MAKRPVYVVLESGDEFIEERFVEFEWFKGFSVSQKQKSIKSLHKEFNKVEVGKNVLEISSKSDVEHGVLASAFNLPIKTIEGKKICTLESLFQSCKKFEKGGPYKDILTLDSLEAKKDERLKKSGDLLCFEYKGEEWSLEPKTHFYDWIYINALYQNKDLVEKIVQYDAFTDIEFN
ncbi:DarT1-associated NADAR antitoxin family protein, partial [Clostridium perfringens]